MCAILKHFLIANLYSNAFFQSDQSHFCDLIYSCVWRKYQKSKSEDADGWQAQALCLPPSLQVHASYNRAQHRNVWVLMSISLQYGVGP